MATPSATVVADSVSTLQSPFRKRITSFQVEAHRFILAEINTHRKLSRSYRSSRAVPTKKLLEEVRTDPALPVVWMTNRPGMQATERMTGPAAQHHEDMWRRAAATAADLAFEAMSHDEPLHKQWANRHIEPYMMARGIITGTEWENFFALRVGPEAQPEFDALAEKMLQAMRASVPRELPSGDWHLPYIDDQDDENIERYIDSAEALWDNPVSCARIVSAARCARVSYDVFVDKRRSKVWEDVGLCQKLIDQGHWGPFEHQATPDVPYGRIDSRDAPDQSPQWFEFCQRVNWKNPHQHGNFIGWIQSRKLFDHEHRSFAI